ncbi:MAG: MATE family efflux transporter [Novosphingobium sp.]
MQQGNASPFRAELGATLRLAAPLALANVLQMAVYAVDVIFVARLGQEALAASSLSVALFGLMNWSFAGLTGAVAPLVAAEMGRRKHAVREVRRSVRMALWLAILCGLAGMVVCSFGEEIMLATGQEPRIAERAGSFLHILQFAMIPMIASNVLRIFVSALGRPVFATAITGLAIIVNAVGNYALVFGNLGAPELGLEGSALASSITAVATFLTYCIAIRTNRRLHRYRVFGRFWRTEWTRFRELVKIGTPIALTVAAEGGLFGGAAFLMGLIGESELAGHTVALQICAFAFQVPFGIAQAATIRVGFHYGAADAAGIARAGKAALIAGIGFMAFPAALMLLAPKFILGAYVDVADPANAAMIGFAVHFLAIGAAFQLFDGTQTVAAGVLRGLQDTRVPMIMALSGYWLGGFATAVILGFLTPLQGIGVWIGLAVGLVIVSALLLRRWQLRDRLGLVPTASARARTA